MSHKVLSLHELMVYIAHGAHGSFYPQHGNAHSPPTQQPSNQIQSFLLGVAEVDAKLIYATSRLGQTN